MTIISGIIKRALVVSLLLPHGVCQNMGRNKNLNKGTGNICQLKKNKCSSTAPPTPSPSSKPSELTSMIPSAIESYAPSEYLSLSPTIEYTGSRTKEPAWDPMPSVSTQAPMYFYPSPTTEPSNAPTRPPSPSPSSFQTILSIVPSAVPSLIPIIIPSSIPSTLPSAVPSLIPTILPSIAPITFQNNKSSSAPFIRPFCESINPSEVTLSAKYGKSNHCYRIQIRNGGELLVDVNDKECKAYARSGEYNGRPYSKYQRTDPGGKAIFEGKWDGPILLLQDPSLSEPKLTLMGDSRKKKFVMTLTVPRCR